jgi:NAD(P)-dependent dehydrogenase (short-subunit alcohol dehydrogenase family)
MAAKGIKVIMACRDLQKAELAKRNIVSQVPDSDIEILQLDLSKLSSVHAAATTFRNSHHQLDILVNNAGIMFPPYSKTEDGFESQMATNCFGHFLFTSLLIDRFPDTPHSRITWLSSSAHKTGKVNLADLNFENKYSKTAAYAQSKLVCLMYSLELNRRLKASGKQIVSNCAHPGGVMTNLSRNMSPWLLSLMKYTLLPLITHSASSGAMPTLEAALSATSQGGQYFGPQGFLEMSGESGIATIAKQALDTELSKALWQLSEALTGAKYHL